MFFLQLTVPFPLKESYNILKYSFRNHLYDRAISQLNDIYRFHRYDTIEKIDEEVFQQLLDEIKNGMAVNDEKK